MNNGENKDLTRIFLELYAERVAIMQYDGEDDNAEKNAYEDIVRTLQRKMPECIEQFPSLEQCKASEQYI